MEPKHDGFLNFLISFFVPPSSYCKLLAWKGLPVFGMFLQACLNTPQALLYHGLKVCLGCALEGFMVSWVVVSNVFYFQPHLGEMIKFDYNILET